MDGKVPEKKKKREETRCLFPPPAPPPIPATSGQDTHTNIPSQLSNHINYTTYNASCATNRREEY